MTSYMGFHYKEGKKVGYDISCPNCFGGRTVLRNVCYADKGDIVREMIANGNPAETVYYERVENY